MFTGIIECLGEIQEVARNEPCRQMRIGMNKVLRGLKVGDSVAVDGVCLTVEKLYASSFQVSVMGETLNVSNLKTYMPGRIVNLEPAAKVGDAIGGHMIQGHVDCLGSIISRWEDEGVLFEIHVDSKWKPFLVPKGSVACDGISLTISRITEPGFVVSIIPHTLAHTNFREKTIGDALNIEYDFYVKTIINYMNLSKQKP